MKFAIALCLCLSVAFAGQPLPESIRLRDKAFEKVLTLPGGQPLPEAFRPKVRHPNAQLVEGLNTKATCGISNAILTGERIVGGRPANSGEFPWQVSLQRNGIFGKSHSCGGSIVNEYTIVTAAHCVDGAATTSITIRVNTLKHASGTDIAVKKIVVHPGYSSSTIDNDVAVIQLASAITYGTNAGPVCLPEQGKELDDTKSPVTTITGWGTTRESGSISADLLAVDVPLITRTKCREQYGQNEITDNMICAGLDEGGKDACQGDSGGPLVVRNADGAATLYGVVSWGRGCARAGYAGVYTNAANYRTFIDDNTATSP